jgi:hypothetical protein
LIFFTLQTATLAVVAAAVALDNHVDGGVKNAPLSPKKRQMEVLDLL